MGEYADDYFRKQVKDRFGVDPGSMYGCERKPKVNQVKKNKPAKKSVPNNNLKKVKL